MILESLHAVTIRGVFRVREPLVLPGHKGSAIRGAFGHAFKKVACALRRQSCEQCLLRYRCAYSVCFETPVPQEAQIMKKYPYAPHPFALKPPTETRRHYEAGEETTLGMCLIGRGTEFLPHFIYALEELGEQGLGHQRGKLDLLRIEDSAEPEAPRIYCGTRKTMEGLPRAIGAAQIRERSEALRGRPVRLAFATPARIKVGGSFTQEPAMRPLVAALLRRLTALSYFHCGGDEAVEVGPLLEQALAVSIIATDVAWLDWDRYSSRQRSAMQLGGFVGTADYSPIPNDLLPYLAWGELLHVGKASAFGLGQYQMTPLTGQKPQ